MNKKTEKMLSITAWVLLTVGAINWMLTWLKWNLVTMLVGTGTVSKVVYGLVGLSAIWGAYYIVSGEAKKMAWYDHVAYWLVIVGGLNWGLTVFGYNLVEAVLGAGMWANFVYFLVGVSGIYSAYHLIKHNTD